MGICISIIHLSLLKHHSFSFNHGAAASDLEGHHHWHSSRSYLFSWVPMYPPHPNHRPWYPPHPNHQWWQPPHLNHRQWHPCCPNHLPWHTPHPNHRPWHPLSVFKLLQQGNMWVLNFIFPRVLVLAHRPSLSSPTETKKTTASLLTLHNQDAEITMG